MASKIKQSKTASPKAAGMTANKYLFEWIVFAFSFLLYANSIPNGYNLDDNLVTRQHRLTSRGISAIPDILTSPYYQDEAGYKYEYRPVVLISFAIEEQLFGENPHVSHFFNVLLYALVCTLLLIILRKLFTGYSALLVFIIVLIYAAHPVHTEVVDSIKNRDELFALGFALIAIMACLMWVDGGRWWFLGAGIAFTALALLSKFSVPTFLVAAPVLLMFVRDISIRRLSVVCAAFVLPIVILSPFYSIWVQLLFLAGCLVTYVFVYLLLKIKRSDIADRWHLLSERVRSAIHQPSAPDRENQAVQQPEEGETIPAPAWKLLLAGACSMCLMLAVWYLYFRFSVASAFIPALLLGLLYGFTGDAYRRIIFPFIILTSLLLAYFFHDRELAAGFTIAAILTLHIYDTHSRYKYVLLSLLAATVIALWPCNGALFLLLWFVLPARNRFWMWLGRLVMLFSVLLFFLPLQNVLQKDKPDSLLFIGVPVAWALFFLIRRGISFRRLAAGLLICLPFILALVAYDTDRNTILIFKKCPPGLYDSRQINLEKIQIAGYITNAANHAQNTAIREGDKMSHTINPIITQAPPISATYPIISRSRRPVTYIEQPVSIMDPLPVRIATGADMLVRYIRLGLLPYPLGFYYGYSEIKPVLLIDPSAIISLLIIFVLAMRSVWFIRRREVMGLAILVFFILLSPFCTFIMPIPGMFADRFLFVPSLFLCLIAIRVLFWRADAGFFSPGLKWSAIPQYKKAVIIALCGLFSVMTIARTSDWKDALTLYKHDISHLPNSAQAHNLLALELMGTAFDTTRPRQDNTEMVREALSHFRRSVEIYPHYFNTNYDLARTFVQLNEADSAIYWFSKSMAIDSSYTDAAINAGDICFQLGRFQEATPYFQAAIRHMPADYLPYDRLSRIYFGSSRYAEAIEINKKAIKNIKGISDPYLNISRGFQAMNKKDSAAVWVRKALELNPQNQEATLLLKELEK